MGRRFEKEVLNSSGGIVKNISYVYSGEDIIVEDDGVSEKTYFYGKDGIDDGIAFEKNSDLHFYHKDHLGSIIGIKNSSGSLVTSYDYDAYGNFTLSGTDLGNTRLFTGREFDEEINLYYYRARYYSAELGRFISRDPIGITDDINLYAYVGNNPVMFRDPMGMEKSPIEQVASLSPHYDIGGVLGGTALYGYGVYKGDKNIRSAGSEGALNSGKNLINPLKKIKKIEKGFKTTQDVMKKISSHASERMKERGISADDILKTIHKGEKFEYLNNGVKKIGYYLKDENIFVGVGDKITTVIKPTKNYINNLKNTLGK